MTCGREMRTGTCAMDANHRGLCTTVAFYCDACGRMRRGRPAGQDVDINGDPTVVFCWFCINVLGPINADAYERHYA